ncbi:MAG: CBS domain-containing protein, partial [Thermoprotei archaeon]|nr:CBS domain-containing protein [Thermoprotei archaeon]
MPPKVLRYMSSPVIAASPADNLAHIRNLMLRHDISTVVIIDERKRPVGVVSRKELLRVAVAKNWFSRPIDRILASEV